VAFLYSEDLRVCSNSRISTRSGSWSRVCQTPRESSRFM